MLWSICVSLVAPTCFNFNFFTTCTGIADIFLESERVLLKTIHRCAKFRCARTSPPPPSPSPQKYMYTSFCVSCSRLIRVFHASGISERSILQNHQQKGAAVATPVMTHSFPPHIPMCTTSDTAMYTTINV